MGQGWAAGFPILVGWILWETAGLLTRRKAVLDMGLLWPAIFLCIGIGPPLFFLTLEVSVEAPGIGQTVAAGLLWALPWIVPAWLIRRLGQRFVRFREERVVARGGGIPAGAADGVS